MEKFANKVVIVTGGGTGIGKAIAAAFVAGGAKVLITGRRQAVLEQTVAELGPRAAFIAADVCESGASARIVQEAVSTFGRLDVLVNNAGTGTMGPLVETSDADIESTYRINVFAPLALAREAIPHLAETKGAVINISSVTARGTLPGVVAYASSKAAGEHAVRLLASELGPMGIRVNAVAPGFTDTEALAYVKTDEAMMGMVMAQTPMGRLGKPEDIANAVMLLADDRAGWITGQSVQAGGGYML
ncbi:SDR family NAD(P)-dependent oxidoreductase [Shimia sp. MIT1388]|uniref:SDR family NAD(P)-dependent oxidoreductase n=1 Tax=Shimia sp. MIT1388 TaxID=3096992 RepID=UPI003999C508